MNDLQHRARFLMSLVLLNLTGLALGHLYLRRWRSWLLRLAITLSLIATAIFANASRDPVRWISLLALWVLWSAAEGAWQARKFAQPALSQQASRQWFLVTLAVTLIVLEIAGIRGYVALGQQEYTSGITAYQAGDCRAALESFKRVTSVYELTFSANIADADAKIVECTQIASAEELLKKGKFPEAISRLSSFSDSNPKSALVPFARETIGKSYFDWALNLRNAGDPQTAIEMYRTISTEYADTATAPGIAALMAEAFAEWATQLRRAGDYRTAIEKYLIVLNDCRSTPTASQAASYIAQAYAEWAVQLRRAGDYRTAIEKYLIVLSDYRNTPTASQATPDIAQAYAEWGAQLRAEKRFDEAVGKYQTILKDYADTPASKPVPRVLVLLYGEWGDKLRASSEYKDAIEKYQYVAKNSTVAEETQAAAKIIGETYNDWGVWHYSRREYLEAMEKHTLGRQATSVAEVMAAASKGYDHALVGLSEDSLGQGKKVMDQAAAEVIAGKPATSPAIGLAKDQPGKAYFKGNEFALPDDLKATKPAHMQYVVSLLSKPIYLETCTYITSQGFSGGAMFLGRYQEAWEVNVLSTQTAKSIGNRRYVGNTAPTCPNQRTFITGTIERLTGGPPITWVILDWLQTIIK